MKLLLLTLSVILLSCMQTYNSAYRDKLSYAENGVDESTPEGQRFVAAMKIVGDRCVSCHGEFATWNSDTAWKNAGKVVAGNLASSPVYSSLVGSQVGGREDMPRNGSLSASELTIMRNWVLLMP